MGTKSILFVLLCVAHFCASAQQKTRSNYLGVKVGNLSQEHHASRMYGGLSFEYQLRENSNWYLQYDILFGKDYFRMPLGAPLGFWGGLQVLSNNDTGSIKWGRGALVALLGIIIPEGFGYNIKLNDRLEIAPFVRPLQFESIKSNTTDEDANYAAGSIGLQLHSYLIENSLRFSPYIEGKFHYNEHAHPGYSFGASLSMNLHSKKK